MTNIPGPENQPQDHRSEFRLAILPAIMATLEDGMRLSSSEYPETTIESTPQIFVQQHYKTLNRLLLDNPPLTSSPETTALAAARSTGEIIGQIVTEWLAVNNSISLTRMKSLGALANDLFSSLKDPFNALREAQGILIREKIESADWDSLFESEIRYDQIANLLANAGLLASTKSALSYVALRSDLDQAIPGRIQKTETFFNVVGGWSFPEYKTWPDLTQELAVLATVDSLRSPAPREFSYQDINACLPFQDESYIFTDTKIYYFPLLHDDTYLGALYILDRTTSAPLEQSQIDNLVLATSAASTALARIKRIRLSSPEMR